jgi:phage shock protein PspC (stress-responsive transcriptional regulator)
MKKIININFQGRVIPIEETAYDILKQYVDSLRKYFANEEGRDEIINDIESRIAELFDARLKRGAACITDDDVNAVIASIGRPEDFEEQETESKSSTGTTSAAGTGQQQQQYTYASSGSSRLYRNTDDKIIAGVCSGLANSLRIDPAIMRVLFVLFFGVAFWIYIVLWIVLPAQSVKTQITKRLYRNPDGKVIGGVCSGLASYFNTDIWIPRLVFALPLLISVLNGAFRGPWFNFHFFPGFLTGSLTFTLLVIYIVLWIVLPEATTAAEKLEMRGEKIDLNSIRDTVKEDLGSFKEKAQQFGTEVKETAQQFGEKAKEFSQQAGQRAQSFAAEAAPIARKTGNGLGHAIGVLFKIFFFIIAGCIVIGLLAALVALFGVSAAMMPFKGYLLDGGWQNLLAWFTLLFFLGVPIVAFIVWIIRKIVGARSSNNYLSYTFVVLWVIGLFSMINLGIAIKRNFDYKARVPKDYTLIQPATGKLEVKVASSTARYYGGWWEGWRGPFQFVDDSMVVKNIRLKIERSNDSSFHLRATKFSNGSSGPQAEGFANSISFNINQQDSTIYLDNGFSIPRGDKFRNQQVTVTVQVPLGKRIRVDHTVSRYNSFKIDFGPDENWDWDDNRDNGDFWWQDNVEYIMTAGGLEKVDKGDKKNKKTRIHIDENGVNIEENNDDDKGDKRNRYQYRYKQIEDSVMKKAKEQLREELRIRDSIDREKKLKEAIKNNVRNNRQPAPDAVEAGPMPGAHILSPVLIFTKSIQ